MARLKAPSTPRRKAMATSKARSPAQGPPSAKAAVPAAVDPKPPVEEPVWLVRIVLVLFFVGFSAFLAREVYDFVQSLP